MRSTGCACSLLLPFSMLHQVAVLTIGMIVVEGSVGLGMKVTVITSVAFVATMLVYEGLVRRSRPLRVLFGLKGAASEIPHKERNLT